MEILNEKPVKKTKRLTSVVWNHFERIRKADAQYAVCVHCKKKLSGSSNSGTTHLRNHLLRCLKRSNYDVSQILSSKRKRKETDQSPLRPCNASVATISYEDGKIKDGILSPIPLKFNQDHKKEETCQTINLGSVKFDQERSWLDLARMIMLHGYPMTMVDHVGFKIFVKNLQPMFEIKEYGSVELDCLTIYAKEKQNVYETLQRLHGRINLSVGMWGGPYGSEYICLTANYIDEEWRLQKRMLNFQAPDQSNSDDMLSGVVIKSLTDWRIGRKLFSVTFDDTAAYELMVFKIKDWLAQDRPLLRNGELSHVLCITHLLKSIAQEIIEECWELICKIRAGIKHVKGSEELLSEFNKIAQGVGINSCRRPVLDYPMQWDSTYMMLEAACEYRSAFSLLQEHDPSYLKMALSETEWDWASSIAGCMKSILEFTNVVVGNNYPCANIFFPEMCDMHLQLIEWTKSPDDFLRSVALKMKYKFDVYWRKCSLILAVAAILDPRFKMKLVEYYFQQIYGTTAPDRILEVSARLRELFDEYSTLSSSPDQDSDSDRGRGSFLPPSSSSRDKLKGFDKFLYETSQSPSSMSSDLDMYLQEPVFPRNCDFSILNWWKVHIPRYPILSMMARDILAIPVSTLAPDVVFSSSNRILDQYHSSLNPDTREALLCGQDWLRTETQGNLSSSTFPLSLRT